MIDKDILDKKVKKHKKLFERSHLYRWGYEVNGNKYYFAVYKKGEQTTGAVIVSEENENLEDVPTALAKLYRISMSLENVLAVIRGYAPRKLEDVRSNIDCIDRVISNEKLSPSLLEKYKNSRYVFQKMLDGQEYIIQVKDEITAFIEVRNSKNMYQPDDEEILLNYQGHLNLAQIVQLREWTIHFNDMKAVYEDMRNNHISMFNKKELNYFYESVKEHPDKTIKKSIAELSNNADVYNESDEEIIQRFNTGYNEGIKKSLEGMKKKIRYPKGLF